MSIPKWNDIPFNPEDTPQQKADNFDNQVRENGGTVEPPKQKENDGKSQ